MKKLSIALLFTIGVFLFISCNNEKVNIVGEWEIQSISDQEGADADIHALTIINMLSAGSKLTFTENGKFVLGSGESKSEGKYNLSKDGESVEMKNSESSYTFQIVSVSENKIELHSKSDSSIINLKRN